MEINKPPPDFQFPTAKAGTGTPPFTHRILDDLPAGLIFDEETRRFRKDSFPTEEFGPVNIRYEIADSQGGRCGRRSVQEFELAVVRPLIWDITSPNATGIPNTRWAKRTTADPILSLSFPRAQGGRKPIRYQLLNADNSPVTSADLPTGIFFDQINLKLEGKPTQGFRKKTFKWIAYDSRPTWQGERRELVYGFTLQVGSPPNVPTDLEFYRQGSSGSERWYDILWTRPVADEAQGFGAPTGYDFQYRDLSQTGDPWVTGAVFNRLTNGKKRGRFNVFISVAPSGTTLTCRVRATNSDGASDWVEFSFRTQSTTRRAPYTPTGISISRIGNTFVDMAGRADSRDRTTITYWEFQIRRPIWPFGDARNEGRYNRIEYHPPPHSGRITVEGMNPNEEWYVRCRACNQNGCSDWYTRPTSFRTLTTWEETRGPYYIESRIRPPTPPADEEPFSLPPEGWSSIRSQPSGSNNLWRTTGRRSNRSDPLVFDPPVIEIAAASLDVLGPYYILASEQPIKPDSGYHASTYIPPGGWQKAIPTPTTTADVWITRATRTRAADQYEFEPPRIFQRRSTDLPIERIGPYYIHATIQPETPDQQSTVTPPAGWSAFPLAQVDRQSVWITWGERQGFIGPFAFTRPRVHLRPLEDTSQTTGPYYIHSRIRPPTPAGDPHPGAPAGWSGTILQPTATDGVWTTTGRRRNSAENFVFDTPRLVRTPQTEQRIGPYYILSQGKPARPGSQFTSGAPSGGWSSTPQSPTTNAGVWTTTGRRTAGNVPYVFDDPTRFKEAVAVSIRFSPSSASQRVNAGDSLSYAFPVPQGAVGNVRYTYSLPSGASLFGHGFQWTARDRGVSRYNTTASVTATDNVSSATFTLEIVIEEP